MKTQRKLLTDEQKKVICEKYALDCYKCPLTFKLHGISYCHFTVRNIEQAIKDYWNEEIEVQDENI